MNKTLVEVLVRQFEGSSGTPAEARLNNLTANLRFLAKYGHLLPTEVMTAPTILIRGKSVLAQQRNLQTKVYLDQQDITGAFLNPDTMFESAFQEILFMVKSAQQQNLQYLPYVPLNIVVDKEPGTLRPCLTFITRFGITDAVATMQPAVVETKVTVLPAPETLEDYYKPPYNRRSPSDETPEPPLNYEQVVSYTGSTTDSAPALSNTLSVESLPTAPVPRSEPITPLQAAIADSPEELNELPFISDKVAPAPVLTTAPPLYDAAAVQMPVREARTAVTATPDAPVVKKGGWPKGKPRPKKGEPGFKNNGFKPKSETTPVVEAAPTPKVGDFSKVKWG
jgi:hypothetical protein